MVDMTQFCLECNELELNGETLNWECAKYKKKLETSLLVYDESNLFKLNECKANEKHKKV